MSQRLGDRGFRKIEANVCVRTKYAAGKMQRPTGMLAAHVGDILFSGSPVCLGETDATLGALRSGTTARLMPNRPIASLCIRVEETADRGARLAQSHYIAEVGKMDVIDYITEKG